MFTVPRDDLYLQAQLYFGLVFMILIGCGMCFNILMRNPFFLYYKKQSEQS